MICLHQNDNAGVIILLRMAKLKTLGGQPQVGNCLFGSILHINDDMSHLLEFKKVIADMGLNVESSISTTQLNTYTVVAKKEDYYLRFPIKNIDDILNYNKEISLSIIATVIGFDLDECWYSFYCRDCSNKVSTNDDDINVEPFTCDGCGGVSI
ncbi:unnamed protein product [Lactuca saligna]|uniref:Replication factor A C-terminal domain-containing protein n=1 Tax=Lactuca saligna TaxID=75948 RepID=A0AA36EIK7_LACSI|nr:unnamed protein product [Lactuca saligna]